MLWVLNVCEGVEGGVADLGVAAWAGESVWLYTVATEMRVSVLASCSRNGVDARAIWPALSKNPVFANFRADCPRAEPDV
jgi:hypothetical protein